VSQSRAFQASSNAYILSKFVSGDNRRGLPTPSNLDIGFSIPFHLLFSVAHDQIVPLVLLNWLTQPYTAILNQSSDSVRFDFPG